MNGKRLFVMVAMLLALLGGMVGATTGQVTQASGGQKGQAVPGQGQGGLKVESAPAVQTSTGFTYQGRLVLNGSPASGNYDFTFTLYDALTGGNQIGSTITVLTQTLSIGTFSEVLDFGPFAFQGDARWLQIGVRPSGSPSFTILAPRQALTPAPYALSLRPGANIIGTIASPGRILGVTNFGTGDGIVVNASGTGTGLVVSSSSGTGIYASGDNTDSAGVSGAGYYGVSGEGHYGVWGEGNSGTGGAGVRGESVISNGIGLLGVANYGTSAAGVYGSSSAGYGVYGLTTASNSIGLYGQDSASSGKGVYGFGRTDGVYGTTGNDFTGVGVYGYGDDGVKGIGGEIGLDGESTTGIGVFGYGSQWAGDFQGSVTVSGSCCFAQGGTYKIDDPLDPANKYLNQAAVESPDMMDIYNGNVTTNAKGEAVVTLPDYFEALNKDFRYQLTPIGQFAQVIVSEEIKGNHFTIKTDKPNVKVSWQVTGVRQDPYAAQHPIAPEQDKASDERGKYLDPTGYGQPDTAGVGYSKNQPPNQSQPPSPGSAP